jgi:hypothetical protein
MERARSLRRRETKGVAGSSDHWREIESIRDGSKLLFAVKAVHAIVLQS